jgi:hypothetical protein
MPVDTAPAAGGVASARADYERMTTDREPFLRRARMCAKVTVPWLIVPQGHTSTSDLPTPFQSVGARGVNNLASKLLLALFPPNAPFFKFRVEPYTLAKITGVKNAREQVEQNLVKAEEAILGEMEAAGFRIAAHEAIRHLLVAGNALMHWPDDGEPHVFHLDEYVVDRDPATGEPVYIITRERLDGAVLPAALRAMLPRAPSESAAPARGKVHDLYTVARFARGKWRIHQEFADKMVVDSDFVQAKDAFEYFALRGNQISGENYGRGHVEEYLGDLISLEGLTQAIVEGSAAAARILFLVNPAGLTDVETLSTKPNGAFAPGVATDVTVLQLAKFADFQIAANTANAMEQRLSYAFLLNSAVQRDAERVTAEEIRFVAQELEQTLGGLYSVLSRELQLPVVGLVEGRMSAAGKLPKIPKAIVKPAVVTGIEALGRGNDLNRLNAAIATLTSLFGPDVANRILNPLAAADRIFTASGVRTEGLLKTADELQQEAQQARASEMTDKLGPTAIREFGSTMRDQVQAATPQ